METSELLGKCDGHGRVKVRKDLRVAHHARFPVGIDPALQVRVSYCNLLLELGNNLWVKRWSAAILFP